MSIVDKGVGNEGAVSDTPSSLRRLADIYHELLAEQTLDVLLDKIADALEELVPYDTLTIYRAEEQKDSLVPVLARDTWANEIMKVRIAYGEGITGWVAVHREAVRLGNAQADPRVEEIPGTPKEREAMMSLPLVARDQVKGVLNLYRQGEDDFTDSEFALAKRFADSAALAIDNAEIRAALEYQAQTDPLTGLYNHRFFQERLRSELVRTTRNRDTVALILFDIDDFKKLNDVHGHGCGDGVLMGLADILRDTIRASDVACRVGGEEFAVILPSCDAGDAMGLARRLRDRLAVREFEPAGPITLSIGIAQGPEQATNPRELVACAEMAMMTAKARGKNQAVLYDAKDVERPREPIPSRDDVRSIAHLKMLQSLAGKLNRLNEVRHIAETISDELRTLIDYHNCRVYITEGRQLLPVAVRGDLAEGKEPTLRVLEIGEGIAGRAAATGRSLLIPNAMECDFAVTLPGTEDVEESIVAVPMLYGSRVNGVVLLSQLGVGEFDEDDVRLLEVLAGQASVALENARLYDAQRREAENARALLQVSDNLLGVTSYHEVGDLAVQEGARLLGAQQVTLWLKGKDGTYRCASHHGFAGDEGAVSLVRTSFSEDEAKKLHEGRNRPYVIYPEEIRRKFPDHDGHRLPSVAAIAPLKAGPYGDGWIAVRQPAGEPFLFSEDRMRLLAGFAHQVTVALEKAGLYREQKEAADVASSLLGFSHEISSIDNRELLLQRIVARSAEILGAPQAMLWLCDPMWGEMVCEAVVGYDDHEAREYIAKARFPMDVADPFLSIGTPFVLRPADYEAIPGVPIFEEKAVCAIAPFKVDGRGGCLIVTAPILGDYEFSARKMLLLSGLADQTKLALENASSYQALEDTFVSTVEALANALEANDEYTSSHARSIAEMTREMGEALGMESYEIKRLEMGALFHDIGKIGIPSEILLKDGPLDPDEWEIMKRHPELGERILEPIERLQDVCPIVRHCHEHYDGTGYPDGLIGEDIPLESRIILVCDAFNAMTTDRPYREALPIPEAVARLQNRAGTQFDPRIVEVFVRLLETNPGFGLSD